MKWGKPAFQEAWRTEAYLLFLDGVDVCPPVMIPACRWGCFYSRGDIRCHFQVFGSLWHQAAEKRDLSSASDHVTELAALWLVGVRTPPRLFSSVFSPPVCSTAIKSRARRRWVCQRRTESAQSADAAAVLILIMDLWQDRTAERLEASQFSTFALVMRDLQALLSSLTLVHIHLS